MIVPSGGDFIRWQARSPEGAKIRDRANLTTRDSRKAHGFRVMNDEGVKFGEGLGGMTEGPLDEVLDGFVAPPRRGVAHSSEKTARVGINHEDRVAKGIGKERIGGFFPNSGDSEEPFPACCKGRLRLESVPRATKITVKRFYKGKETLCFHRGESRRLQAPLKQVARKPRDS
jgi:hypothetical protein